MNRRHSPHWLRACVLLLLALLLARCRPTPVSPAPVIPPPPPQAGALLDSLAPASFADPFPDAPAPPDVWRGAMSVVADEAPDPQGRRDAGLRAAAARLADRAAEARRAAEPRRALSLAEAALLLDPARLDVRRLAVTVYGELAREQLLAGGERTLEQVTAGTEHYFRGLHHLETYLRTESADDLQRLARANGSTFIDEFFHSNSSWGTWGHPSPAVLDALASGGRREREVLLEIVRRRARAGRGDEWRFMDRAVMHLPPAEKFELLARTLEELAGVPGSAHRVHHFARHCFGHDAAANEQGGRFLDRLAAGDSAEIREAVREFREKTLPALREQMRQHQAIVERARRPPPAVPPPADAGGDLVTWEPLDFPFRRQGRPLTAPMAPLYCLAAGDGLDVFWDSKRLYVMARKGELAPLYEADRNAQINEPCFDGKYVWAPVILHEPKDPLFIVADPRAGRVWTVTAADGLRPTTGGIESSAGSGIGQAQVTPLSPGRACLAGAGEGKAWVATATFDPAAGRATVRVFHEAAEPPDADAKDHWSRPAVLFNPLWMRTIARWRGAGDASDGSGAAGTGTASPGGTRVLIGRGSSSLAVANHLLLVDPDGESASVAADDTEPLWNGEMVAAHGPAAYWAWYPLPREATAEDTGPSLWRVGFPDFRRERAARAFMPSADGRPQRFSVAFAKGRTYVFGDQLWAAEKPEGPFRRVSGTPPDLKPYGDPWLRESSHHGLVLTVGGQTYGARFGTQ